MEASDFWNDDRYCMRLMENSSVPFFGSVWWDDTESTHCDTKLCVIEFSHTATNNCTVPESQP